MTQKKIRKPAAKKKPVEPKIPPGVQQRIMTLEERKEMAERAKDELLARINAIAGQIQLLDQLIKERDNAEKEIQTNLADGGDKDT